MLGYYCLFSFSFLFGATYRIVSGTPYCRVSPALFSFAGNRWWVESTWQCTASKEQGLHGLDTGNGGIITGIYTCVALRKSVAVYESIKHSIT